MNRYRQGYLAELELVRMLKARKEFHTVIRSAGSRSLFDVVAIGESQILLCQVKTGKGNIKAVSEKLKKLKVPRCANKQIRIFENKKWTTVDIS